MAPQNEDGAKVIEIQGANSASSFQYFRLIRSENKKFISNLREREW